MIFKVSNNEDDIEKLLFSLKESYGEYAFISYIDGEYGARVAVYNSLVYKFYNEMKEKKIVCIGIVFRGTTSFLDNLCDHIIEIDDVEFLSNAKSPIEDNSHHSLNHANAIVPSNIYEGTDGWDLVYIRGIYCKQYEDILLKLDFKNIFYTLHVDGYRFINSYGCNYGDNHGVVYKIDDINVTFPKLTYTYFISISVSRNKSIKNEKTNKVAVWIRSTNKWPEKNMPENYYKTLFNFCINNNKVCYVFQDLLPVELPKHENIIDCTNRFKNRPNFDEFFNISNTVDIFFGADSGATQFLAYSSTSALVVCFTELLCVRDKNIICNVSTGENLTNLLKNYYQT